MGLFYFSSSLRNRAITYFKQRYGFVLSEEEVERYLESFAHLYKNLSVGEERIGGALERPPSRS